MNWIALAYGLLLGAAQFFVLRAIWLRSLAQQPGPIGPLLAGGGAYLAAAGAAIYLFTDELVFAGGGMLGGMAVTAVLWFVFRMQKWKNSMK